MSWRQSFGAVVATMMVLVGLVLVLRSDGLPVTDAASSRATRWFVHEESGRAVLIDGFGGRALASLELDSESSDLRVAEGAGQAFLLDDAQAEVRVIDTAELRLGPPLNLASLGDGAALARAGSSGLLVANPLTGTADLVPTGEDPVEVSFESAASPGLDISDLVTLAADGSIWSLVDGELHRSTTQGSSSESIDVDNGALTLVGNQPLVVDRTLRRARLGTGLWVSLEGTFDGSDLVVQQPGQQSDCGWVGVGNALWCVGEDGIEHERSIDGLSLGGSDILAIAGDAAAVVRRGPAAVVQFDWRSEEILDSEPVTVEGAALLDVTATTDVIWVDDPSGDFVWSVHPWGIEAVRKNESGLLVLGEQGEVLEGSDSGSAGGIGDSGRADDDNVREPDDNGIDDPPVAVDDQVTARTNSSVPVAVTANDYDPDGEPVAVVAVGAPGHGTVEVGTATTVVYTPDSGYVGFDEFDYRIVDGDGDEATATVTVELLPVDATNQPPVGSSDWAQTGPATPVTVDVLLNDIDPERDGLRIDSFTDAEEQGTVTETVGLSGLPALEFTPAIGLEGTVTFTYRPRDSFDAVGEPVDVVVEIARADEENRPPIVRPDAVLTRRGTESLVPVLVNDVDPDGDPLFLSVRRPLPDGIDVRIVEGQLGVTARPGSGDTVTFEYAVDDNQGNVVFGSVLVVVIDESEPNRPPVVVADTETAVVGQTILIDVTANDSDPDGDPLAILAVSSPDGGGTVSRADDNQVEFTAAAISEDTDASVRFTYTVTDGNGHEVDGDVTVTVLAEPLPVAPYARDDSTITFVDEPVTVDVLRNDGDPSGERPTLRGTPGCPTGGVATVTSTSQVRYDPPAGESGAFRCTYEVTNSQGLTDSADILISVREPENSNLAPIAVLDREETAVGEPVDIRVLTNDSDPDGSDSALEVTSSTQPLVGTASRDGNVITYVSDEVTVASFEYEVQDEDGATSTARVQVRVTDEPDQPPTARPVFAEIEGPGVPTSRDVVALASDVDDPLDRLALVNASLISGDGSVTFAGSVVTIVPNPDYVGQIIAEFTIRDVDGLEDTSTFTLTITEPANRPPVATDDSALLANGATAIVPVLFNDTDPDGDSLTVSIVSNPDSALGSASVTSDQAIRFDAVAGQSGSTSLIYQVSDGEETDTATVRVSVASCQASQPVASDAFLETPYETPIAINLADYAANGQVVETSGPPTFVNGLYTPPAGMNDNASITFVVRNECSQQSSGTITIDVNQAPAGQDRVLTMGRSTSQSISVNDLGTDDEPLSIVSMSGAPGWATNTADSVSIDAPSDAPYGTTQWTVVLADPGGLTTTVEIAVTVDNDRPIAVADTIDASDGVVSAGILLNDNDPDGPNTLLRIQSVPATLLFENGQSGSIVLSSDARAVTIDPGDGRGTATFDYAAVDEGGSVSNTVTVTVTGPAVAPATTTTTTTLPTNGAPTANDQTAVVTAGVSSSVALDVSDPDSDPLTVENLNDPSGVVTFIAGTTFTIVAPTEGTYVVTYSVTDGTDPSGTATLTINAVAATTTTSSVPDTSTTTTTTTTTTTVPVTTTTTTTTVPVTTTTTTTTTTEPPPPTTTEP